MTSTKYDKTPKEQVLYANMLFYGCWSGLAIMIVTYLIYAFGILEPHVPMEVVTSAWFKPVQEYLTVGQVPVGWGWATLLNKGDFLNFLGIVLLAGMTLVCYIPLIVAYLKKKDTLFAMIAVLEILVLAFAASGIVGGGAH
ncbi:DUF1634 domain-containing protein [Desulfolutivibrio sp.]|uniref:DUF1634 domain-containing protein n=1 Tax=Desulfolutivibrio sp. TaxID=2773296 RepID=UPI002F96A8B9